MTELLNFNLDDAYAEIKQQAQLQPITEKQAYNDFVEEYINEKVNLGELDSDQDIAAIISRLKDKWEDYHDNLKIK